jgi:hypothetical protein
VPLPKGTQAHFSGGGAVIGMAYLVPSFLGRRSVTTRGRAVSVVDLGEVGRGQKLGPRRGRTTVGRGFAGNSELVEKLTHRFGFSDGGRSAHGS